MQRCVKLGGHICSYKQNGMFRGQEWTSFKEISRNVTYRFKWSEPYVYFAKAARCNVFR